MDPLPVVEEFDVVEQIGVDFAEVMIPSSIDPLLLQLREEAFDARIVVRTAAPGHAAAHPVDRQRVLESRHRVLAPPAAVENGSLHSWIPSDGFSQRSFDELGVDLPARRIANDFAVV